MATGTSSVGMQIVIDDVPASNTLFVLFMSRPTRQPPRRVGYLWGETYDSGGTQFGQLVFAGPLFMPGRRLVVPDLRLISSDRFVWWVDWNESGLSWTALTNTPP